MRRRALLAGPLLLWPGAFRAAPQPALEGVLGRSDDAGFARADAPRRFEFPADHGAHPDFRSEWWYLTASLSPLPSPASGAGSALPAPAEFGVQFTLFRQALRAEPLLGGPWDASQLYLAHLAVTDVAGARHHHAERMGRGHPRLAGVRAEPFAAWLDGWQLAAAGDVLDGLALSADTRDFGVHLGLEPEKPIALQGDRGLSAKGPGQASYYYSITRLAARGEVRVGDRTVPVGGRAWFDREWSTSVLGAHQSGWDWFALHLDSGEDLMLFQLRRRDGRRDRFDQGLWVAADGSTRLLTHGDFVLEALDRWRDDTGTAWPVAWRMQVDSPAGRRRLVVRAALRDQRMDTLITYWEGLVRVEDESGRPVGNGYMELTGYG